MANLFPYTFISCPCSDQARKIVYPKRASRDVELEVEDEAEDKTFDPRHPRSNFSLFPPEHMLYCEECHDIKCPRCITEEIICWYCPSCLFEVPSSSVKTDENRCSRNCFSCPICTSQLITASMGDGKSGPFILSCNYCMWSSLDIGLKFDTPNLRLSMQGNAARGISKRTLERDGNSSQKWKGSLARLAASRGIQTSSREMLAVSAEDDESTSDKKEIPDAELPDPLHPSVQFAALKTFYKNQISAAGTNNSLSSALDNFASPSSLTRIMNLYNTGGSKLAKATKEQPRPMREALDAKEGMILQEVFDEKSTIVSDYIDAVSPEQQDFQYPFSFGASEAKHVSQLQPMPTLLRTKRSKRCAECKHILVKPEFKVTSTRYRIKLMALNYIPMISLKPLPVSGGLRPPGPDGMDIVLEPGKASQWIMKLSNPLFENVNVSLGSPSVTPGKHGHRVTILCPQFSIGKNGDVWDDALNASVPPKPATGPSGGEQVAGKIYESGRNWVSVVVEVIPALISRQADEELEEDEDVIEIPLRVRVEWTAADDNGERTKKKSDKALAGDVEVDDGKRELAYWMVIGIGRVSVT